MKHVRPCDPIASKLHGIDIITHFQYLPLNISSILTKEMFDVVAVNTQTPVKPKALADGGDSS